MAKPKLSLDEALSTFRRSIFRLQCTYTDPASHARVTTAGTAFIVAVYEDSSLVLASARHVIDPPENSDPEWLVAESSEDNTIVRQMAFKVSPKSREITWLNKHYDVGMIFLKGAWPSDNPFSSVDDMPLPLLSPTLVTSTGSHVAWAGFAAEIEGLFQCPCLCYYEGSVSLLMNRPGASYYIIDGHNAFGVSGGPVWYWSEENNRHEVVGIVSSYKHGASGLPGVVIAEPINHITSHMQSRFWADAREIGKVRIDCRWEQPPTKPD